MSIPLYRLVVLCCVLLALSGATFWAADPFGRLNERTDGVTSPGGVTFVHDPLITRAVADLASTPPIIVIEGKNFGPTPRVFLGAPAGELDELPVLLSTDYLIEAQLITTDPGNYLLVVTSGSEVHATRDDEMDDMDATLDALLWDTSGDDLILDAPGNVGIGTEYPMAKLDVHGDIHATETITADVYASTTRLILEAPQGVERMRVDAGTGNVGIGTANPAEKLDVDGSIHATEKVMASAYDSNSPLILKTDDVERARIDDLTGYFGIGTDDPDANLHVSNSVSGIAQYSKLLILHQKNTTGEIVDGFGPGISLQIEDSTSAGPREVARIKVGRDGNDTSGQITIQTRSNGGVSSNGITIRADGSVGIGRDDDQILGTRLWVEGTLRAEEIFTKELTVKTSWWADSVFEEDYDLMPLDALAEYIRSNGHLPDVPSAREVHENGVSVAESQATLLQKIEELTLHILDQNLRIDELERRLDEQADVRGN